jgi:hypothetical protein
MCVNVCESLMDQSELLRNVPLHDSVSDSITAFRVVLIRSCVLGTMYGCGRHLLPAQHRRRMPLFRWWFSPPFV